MKQTKKRVSYIKNQKPTNIEWILNLLDQIPKYQLQSSIMKHIQVHQLNKLQECDQLLKSNLYTFDNKLNKFTQMQFTLYPNMLIAENQEYVLLSQCIMCKKIIQYKEFTAQGIQLFNSQGNLFLFYESYVQQLNWEKQLKRFSKQQNFSNKYTIKEKLSVINHYACVKNKNNRVYTVQLVKLSGLTEQSYEALMNEINIIMCFKQSGLHQFHALFEDGDILYILYDYWMGDTLYKLIQQGCKFNASQIAQIIFQIIKVIRFLNSNNLFHGAILPTSIIIHRQQQPNTQQLKITLFNFAFRDQISSQWLNKRIPKQWIPPEMNNLQIKTDYSSIDVYQIGVLLYYLTFYQTNNNNNNNNNQHKTGSFQKSLENFKIDYQWLQTMQQQEESHEFSFSLIELMLGLLDPNFQNRISLTTALAHQWLTRQKQTYVHEKPKILPSLRTILELREQSSCEMLSSRMGREEQHVTSSSEDDIDLCDDEFIHRISKENNKIPYYQNMLGLLPNKHPSRNKQIIDQIQDF